jgi:hypothetical protein
MPHKVRRAVGVAALGLGLVFAMAPAASAMAYAQPGNSTAVGVLSGDESNGTNVGGAAADVPVLVCGNSVNAIAGIGAKAHCLSGSTGHSSDQAVGVLAADDSNGLNLGGIGLNVPVDVCGNAINAILGIGAKAHC